MLSKNSCKCLNEIFIHFANKSSTIHTLCQSSTNNSSLSFRIEIINLNCECNKSKFYGSLVQKLPPWDFVTCLWKYDIQLLFRGKVIFFNPTKVKWMISGLDISYLQSMHFNFEINYPFIILLSKNTPIRNSNVCELKRVNDHS